MNRITTFVGIDGLLGFRLVWVRSEAEPDSLAARVFPLGVVDIRPQTEIRRPVVTPRQIEYFNRLDVAALSLLPGVTSCQVGPRNKTSLHVRGFDLRQVPVFIDGKPRVCTQAASFNRYNTGVDAPFYRPPTLEARVNNVFVKITRGPKVFRPQVALFT